MPITRLVAKKPLDFGAAQQIVGRERRERVSQLVWCGGPDVSGLIRAAASTLTLCTRSMNTDTEEYSFGKSKNSN